MKNTFLSGLLLILAVPAFACPVCEKQQPQGFAGITHGTGPEDWFDYLVLYGSIAVVLLTLVLFVRHAFRPGEGEPAHVKHQIFSEN